MSEFTETRGGETLRRLSNHDLSFRPVERRGEIDTAARIAERRIAAILIDAALRLVQVMAQSPNFGSEARGPPRDLTQIALAQEKALGRVHPVDEPNLDQGIVETAGAQILLLQAVRAERA